MTDEIRKLLNKAADYIETATNIIEEECSPDEEDTRDALELVADLRRAALQVQT